MEFPQLARSSLTFIVYVTALYICWYIYKKITIYVLKLPPGPIGLPLVGYTFFFDKELHKDFHRLRKTYGPLSSYSVVSRTIVVVSDYDYAQELLSHPATLARPEKLFHFFPANAGFLGMNGEVWKEQRRFCLQTMRYLGMGRNPSEDIIQNDLSEFVEYIQEQEDNAFDISRPLIRSVTSSITALLFGRRFIQKEKSLDVEVVENAIYAITELLCPANAPFTIPRLFKYLVKFNIFGYGEKIQYLKTLSDKCRTEIMEREDSADPADFIGFYMEAIKRDATDGNSAYSVENLLGNMAALFAAGNDTIIASIQWLIVLMAAHLEIQEIVQKEIDDVIGKDGRVCWNDRKRLPYTMATIFETERWAVVVPIYIPRCATETFEFRGYRIPEGTMIIGNAWSMHRDPKLWDNPDEFAPQRFLQTDGRSVKDPSKMRGYAPFSFGKRNCPGEAIAIMTTFLYFTSLMQKFTIKAPPGLQVLINALIGGVVHPESQELCFIKK